MNPPIQAQHKSPSGPAPESHLQLQLPKKPEPRMPEAKTKEQSAEQVDRKSIAELALRSALSNREMKELRLSNAERLLHDPSLEQLTRVFKVIERNKDTIQLKSIDLSAPSQRAEAALWVCRKLESSGKESSLANIVSAIQEIDSQRTALANTAVFKGKAVLIAADSQSIAQASEIHDLSTRSLVREAKGGDYLFGSEKMLESISAAVGPNGSVELLRANPQYRTQVEHMLHAERAIVRASLEPSMISPTFQRDMQKALVEEFRLLFAPNLENAETACLVEPGIKCSVVKLAVRSEDKVVASCEFLVETGKKESRIDLISLSVDSEKCEPRFKPLAAKDAKKQFLERVSSKAPTDSGFVCYLDGHGAPDLVSLATAALGDEALPITSSYVTAEELARAFIKRAERYDTSKDAVCISACFSGDFAHRFAKALKGSKAAPLILATTESGQVMVTSFLGDLVDYELGGLLKGSAKKESSTAQGPKLGDLLEHVVGNERKNVFNRTILAPRIFEDKSGDSPRKGEVLGYDQISRLTGAEKILT